MRTPKIIPDLTTHEVVKDKPAWQRWLYARLHERSSDNTAKITYKDRDASAKNPTRADIQKWYEQIYSELAMSHAKVTEERGKLESNLGELHRSASRVDQSLQATHLQLEQVRAERDAIIDLITRAHTVETQVEDYVNTYRQS